MAATNGATPVSEMSHSDRDHSRKRIGERQLSRTKMSGRPFDLPKVYHAVADMGPTHLGTEAPCLPRLGMCPQTRLLFSVIASRGPEERTCGTTKTHAIVDIVLQNEWLKICATLTRIS